MSAAYLLMFCRITIALVFVWSFLGKIRDIPAFENAIIDFRLFPVNRSKALAWVSLSSELIIILCMVIGRDVLLVGFLLTTGLLLIFSTALVMVVRRKLSVRCNCFGWTAQRVSSYDVVRNMLFILCSLVGIWVFFAPFHTLSGSEIILISLIAMCFVALVTGLADVVETLRQPIPV